MKKVNLISVKKVEVYEGEDSVEIREPLEQSSNEFRPLECGECVEDLVEIRERIPIQLFIHMDIIYPGDSRIDGRDANQMAFCGYYINHEENRYEKEIECLIATTSEAFKFIDMEKGIIEDLKDQTQDLQNELCTEKYNLRLAIKQLEDLKEENSKRWSTKIKHFFKRG